MTTKERIIDEALTLFSVKGFKGTSVKNIADAVGIKDSSLYKHFKSKREIFDTIVAKVGEKMQALSENVGIPTEENLEEAVAYYGKLSEKQLQELSKKIFLFYLEDDFMSRFWRMANMEQYQNSEISEIFRKIYMEDSIVYQSRLFEEMIKQGYFFASSPEVIAMNFYTPIFFLLSKYNNRPKEREEALLILKRQVSEFYRIYRKNGKTGK
ncbi:MAG: TetR/AcrR family transcriptional regulator [Lachnospiraceae bacterium]|uniref:TetR/AcrR family transcriptional regulator n=1 Tax=Roseburia hominis TaxID=301301 RepID=UPI001F465961|nr:TetR/AcrR family transcriptional regulator [Roseburia hominis]MCI5713351.1 TetR/AcrR family transcriptional regulator [Lachnospiraceae bacterium]MDD6170700.1 TetR/AcrR family transcriptional regulator [Lachnospiraceae bacterium]